MYSSQGRSLTAWRHPFANHYRQSLSNNHCCWVRQPAAIYSGSLTIAFAGKPPHLAERVVHSDWGFGMQSPGCSHLRGGDETAASSPIVGVERDASIAKATCAGAQAGLDIVFVRVLVLLSRLQHEHCLVDIMWIPDALCNIFSRARAP